MQWYHTHKKKSTEHTFASYGIIRNVKKWEMHEYYVVYVEIIQESKRYNCHALDVQCDRYI